MNFKDEYRALSPLDYSSASYKIAEIYHGGAIPTKSLILVLKHATWGPGDLGPWGPNFTKKVFYFF